MVAELQTKAGRKDPNVPFVTQRSGVYSTRCDIQKAWKHAAKKAAAVVEI